MLSKRYEPTGVDHGSWIHVPSITYGLPFGDTCQVVEIQNVTSYNV